MAELLRPGVYVEEIASPPGIPTVPVSTGAFIGVADRGPVNTAVFVDSFTTYWNRFGGYRSDSFLTYAVKAFFDNGGSRCYVVRVKNNSVDDAKEAELDLADIGADVDAYTVATLDVGAFGNLTNAGTTKYETLLAFAIPITTPLSEIIVDDVSGFVKGDVIYLDDGSDQDYAVVQSIVLADNKIILAEPLAPSANFLVTVTRVATSSQHRVTTEAALAIPSGPQTTLRVNNANNIRVGQELSVSDGVAIVDNIVVTGVNGNDIIFGSTDMTPGFATPASTLVVSHEFILRFWDTGEELQPFEFLSNSATNKQDYVENRLSGDSNESLLIDVTQGVSASTGVEAMPIPIISTVLTGGLDGTTPVDADYVGNEALATGFRAFDLVTDMNFLSAPGVTSTTVQQGGVDYAELATRQDIMFICDAPTTKDTPTEIRDWRLNILNKDTSYAALYYPWVQAADPEADGQNLYLPPSGHIMGIYSAVARTNGPHTPPANIAISGINGVQYDVSDPQWDTLNPIGVNVIKAYPGEGIRVMGSRTLQTAQDGKHYVNVRLLTNFLKTSLGNGLRTYVQKAIDPLLWEQISATITDFMSGIWKDGWLFPSDSEEEAYSVKCDRENNTQTDINAGRVNVSVGYNPPFPAEFIVLRLSRIGGTVAVSE